MNITEVIEQIEKLTKNIFNEKINSYECFFKLYLYIKEYYDEFIKLLPDLNAIGVDIEMERLLQDMREMAEAIEKKDKVLLFDTLKYRVTETLGWYKQIKEIMEEE